MPMGLLEAEESASLIVRHGEFPSFSIHPSSMSPAWNHSVLHKGLRQSRNLQSGRVLRFGWPTHNPSSCMQLTIDLLPCRTVQQNRCIHVSTLIRFVIRVSPRCFMSPSAQIVPFFRGEQPLRKQMLTPVILFPSSLLRCRSSLSIQIARTRRQRPSCSACNQC